MTEKEDSKDLDEGSEVKEKSASPRASNWIPYVALWSGTFGALASSFGKVAFCRGSSIALIVGWWFAKPTAEVKEEEGDIRAWLTWYEVVVRLLFLLAMITCNVVAVGNFVQGLEDSGSIKGTALTTAANCLVSTMLGVVLWKDDVPSVMGLFCVLVGIVLLVIPSEETKNSFSSSSKSKKTD